LACDLLRLCGFDVWATAYIRTTEYTVISWAFWNIHVFDLAIAYRLNLPEIARSNFAKESKVIAKKSEIKERKQFVAKEINADLGKMHQSDMFLAESLQI